MSEVAVTVIDSTVTVDITESPVTVEIGSFGTVYNGAGGEYWPFDFYSSELETVVASVGDAITTLVITSPQTLGASLSIPGTCSIEIKQGGIITVPTGTTLTIGSFSAGMYQCFAGAGGVIFAQGALNTVYPVWFGEDLPKAVASVATPIFIGYRITTTATGATTYALTNTAEAGQTAEAVSVSEWSRVVQLTDGYDYILLDTLIIPDGVTVRGTGLRQTGYSEVGAASFHNARILADDHFANAASGDYTAPVIKIGNPDHTKTHWSYDARLENVIVGAQWVANTGVYSDSANENSGVFHCMVLNMLQYGIHFDDSHYVPETDPPGAPPNNNTMPRVNHTGIEDCQAIFTTMGDKPHAGTINLATAAGIAITGSAASAFIDTNINIYRTTCNSFSATVSTGHIQTGIYLNNTRLVSVKNTHVENCVDGITIGAGSSGVLLETINGHPSVQNTVRLLNGAQNDLVLINIHKGPTIDEPSDPNWYNPSYILKDERYYKTKLWADNYIALFADGKQHLSSCYKVDTADSPNSTILGDLPFWALNGGNTNSKLAGAIWIHSNGDWATDIDQDFAPSKMFLAAGTSDLTDDVYAKPNLELREDYNASYRDLKLKDHTWEVNRLIFGTYILWIDSSGKLRIKNGEPVSDTDGTIVGTQS